MGQTQSCAKTVAQLGQHLPKALSWIQQGKRANTNIKQKSQKSKKKGDFKTQYNNAIPTLGGDVKKLKCKGNSLKSDDNFTVALDTLKNCSETIKKDCEKALPTGLEANIEKCNKLAEEFRAEYRKQLIQASEDKICTNAEKLNAQWAAVKSACEKDFNVTKAELSQLEEKTACVKAFVICRKEERRLPEQMNKCLPSCNNTNTTTPTKATGGTAAAGGTTANGGTTGGTTATGATTTSSSSNKENAERISEAVASAITALLNALSGTINGRAFAKRQTSSKCAEVITLVETALSKGKAAITAANQTNVDDSKTTEAEAALNAITSRSTLKEDIAACSADQKAELEKLKNELSAWKNDVVDKVVSTLGGKPGTTGGTSAGATVETTAGTSASSGETTATDSAKTTPKKTTVGSTTTSKTTKDTSEDVKKLNELNETKEKKENEKKEKEAKKAAAKSAGEVAGNVSKKIQEATSRRGSKRATITCDQFIKDSEEFSKIDLNGTADEINETIRKYSGLASATIDPACNNTQKSELQATKQALEKKIEESKELENTLTTEIAQLSTEIEALKNKITALEDSITAEGGTLPTTMKKEETTPLDEKSTSPAGLTNEGSSQGGSSPGSSTPEGSSPGGSTTPGGSTSTGGPTTTAGSTSTGGPTSTGGSTTTAGSTPTGGPTSTGGSTTTAGSTSTGKPGTTGGTSAGATVETTAGTSAGSSAGTTASSGETTATDSAKTTPKKTTVGSTTTSKTTKD